MACLEEGHARRSRWAAPAKFRAGKGFPKPYFNAEILRLRKERVRVLVEIKVLEREGGDTSDLWAEFRALRAKAKREQGRAVVPRVVPRGYYGQLRVL